MSFSNPFQSGGGAAGSLDSQTASIEYFSGNPNPQTLEQPELVMIFKNLLRKDQTTREKASSALLEALDWTTVEEALHLAWIQLYLKLCFDISPLVRSNSHQILGKMYSGLGKKSTKYLKYTLPCLLAGTYDPVPSVAAAASAAFELTFNTPERRNLVTEKFSREIGEFAENVVLVLTPQTLSDERYISKEESQLKYDRVLKQALDLLTSTILGQKTEVPLLESTRTWKLMANTNPSVAKSALGLATAAIDRVDSRLVFKQIIKAMNKPQPQSSVELVRALLCYTKAYPTYWDSAAKTALEVYLKSAALYPKPFWPLFYNLALLVVDKPLVSVLGAVATKIVGPTQNDVWGCLVGLASKAKAMEVAVGAVAARCERSLPKDTTEFIAARFKKIDKELLLPHLEVFNFVLILAAAAEYTPLVSQAAPNFSLAQVAQLVRYDPKIEVKVPLESAADLKSILEIAVCSATADSQELAAAVMRQDPELLLEYSEGLCRRGVKLDLVAQLDMRNAETLKKAICAHGGLVDDASAQSQVLALASSVAEGNNSESLRTLGELAESDPQFIQKSLGGTDLGSRVLNELHIRKLAEYDQGLEPLFKALTVEDSSDAIVEELLNGDLQSSLDILVGRAVKMDAAELPKLLLVARATSWVPADFWPGVAGSAVYPVPWAVEEVSGSCLRVLSIGIYLVNLLHARAADISAETRQKCVLEVALVATACRGLEYGCGSEIATLARALRTESESLVEEVGEEQLWDLVSLSGTSSAYYAAQLLYPRLRNRNNAELCQKYRAELSTKSVCAALLAQLHAGAGIPWYERDQQSTYRELGLGKQINLSEFACIDPQVNPEKFRELVAEQCESADEPLLQEVLRAAGAGLEHEHAKRALEYGGAESKLLALPHLKGREVVRAAGRLERVDSEQERRLVWAFLERCRTLVHEDLGCEFAHVSKDPEIGWVFYCCKRGRAIARYREKYEATGDARIELEYGSLPDWLLYLDLVAEQTRLSQRDGKKSVASTTTFSEYDCLNRQILDYIGERLPLGVDEVIGIEEAVGNHDAGVSLLFYRMCTLFGTLVRQWYRENKPLQGSINYCLESIIVPETMRELSRQVRELRQDGVLESTSVSERGREFRAMIEVDETVAQIVITLDAHFPVKNASVELLGLDGVPEHKKRGWMIEAEYSVQNGSIVNAMRTLILKVNNFLEGIEPCAICYSVMEGKNLPSKVCATCKNKYHTECLFKWFSSNKGEKNCPMCRSRM